MKHKKAVLAQMLNDFRKNWRTLALADIAYKIISVVLIVPLVGVLFRVLMAFSGNTVLADTDILYFFLGPLGWICIVLIGGLWLAIVATEQCTLLGILAAARQDNRLGVINALRFARSRFVRVIKVSARLVAISLLIAAPFLAVGGLIYLMMLNDYDINYYLTHKPPKFWIAGTLIGIVLLGLALILLRVFSGWFLALPIVAFEEDPTRDALKSSSERAKGHRLTIGFWIATWAVVSFLLSAAVSGIVNVIGRFIVPGSTSSIALLFLIVGSLILLLALSHLVISLISSISFSVMVFNVYHHVGAGDVEEENRLIEQSSVEIGEERFKLTRMRLVIGSIIALLLALTIGGVVIKTFDIEDSTLIAAHRGASFDAPENTMAAVELAIEQNADYVEIDVQETADGEVVVFHDSDFKKIAGLDLKIWDATMQDLADIDIGSFMDPKFSDQRVPTLRHVLEHCKGKIKVNIELKYYDHDVNLEQKVVDIVEETGMSSEIIVMSLKIDGVRKIKELRPDWHVGLLSAMAIGDLTEMDADFLAVNGNLATRAFVRRAHRAGKDVHVWTINDALTMSSMIGRRVDCVITDKPQLARTVLEERDKMSPVERLLMELASLFGAKPEIADQ